MQVKHPEDFPRLLASWAERSPPVLIPRLVEAAILWEEGRGCGSFFEAIPWEHKSTAYRHAVTVLQRLEDGPTRASLLEALVKCWPLEVLKLSSDVLSDVEQDWVILELFVHPPVAASPADRRRFLEELARALSVAQQWRAIEGLQNAEPSARAWGLAALAPRLAAGSGVEWERPVLEELQRSRDTEEVRELFSLLLSSSPESWFPWLFELLAQESFARTHWFVQLMVASSDQVPSLIGPAIQAAGALENPWSLFEEIASWISMLPVGEQLGLARSLWTEAQKSRARNTRGIVLLMASVIKKAAPQLQGVLATEALDLLEQQPAGDDSIRRRFLLFLLGFLPEELVPRATQALKDLGLEEAMIPRLVAPAASPAMPAQAYGLDLLSGGMAPADDDLLCGDDIGDLCLSIEDIDEDEPLAVMEDPRAAIIEELERALPPAEPVLLGASAPAEVSPGDEFTARFVACVERLEREVAAKLELVSPEATTAIGLQRSQWQLGSRFRVRATSSHLRVSPAEQEFIWNADASVLDFGVQVPPGARGKHTSIQFEVFLEGVRVALLRHDVSVALWGRAAARRRTQLSRAPRTAFASFASADRDRVLDRVASLRLVAGLEVFVDCLSLKPGDEFKKTLQAEIKQRDLFLLFWSCHALVSQWVEWEWRTALRVKPREAIQPHPLESIAVAPPPKELEMLHFGDPYMLARSVQ